MGVFFVLFLSMQTAPEIIKPLAPVAPPAEAAQQAVRQADPDDEMICRRERVLSSNIPVTICQTRGEIEARTERTGRMLRGRPGLAGGRPVGTNLDD